MNTSFVETKIDCNIFTVFTELWFSVGRIEVGTKELGF